MNFWRIIICTDLMESLGNLSPINYRLKSCGRFLRHTAQRIKECAEYSPAHSSSFFVVNNYPRWVALSRAHFRLIINATKLNLRLHNYKLSKKGRLQFGVTLDLISIDEQKLHFHFFRLWLTDTFTSSWHNCRPWHTIIFIMWLTIAIILLFLPYWIWQSKPFYLK